MRSPCLTIVLACFGSSLRSDQAVPARRRTNLGRRWAGSPAVRPRGGVLAGSASVGRSSRTEGCSAAQARDGTRGRRPRRQCKLGVGSLSRIAQDRSGARGPRAWWRHNLADELTGGTSSWMTSRPAAGPISTTACSLGARERRVKQWSFEAPICWRHELA